MITGVADYGFFAQAERFPAEGLVHISSLVDDYYWFDEDAPRAGGQAARSGGSGSATGCGWRWPGWTCSGGCSTSGWPAEQPQAERPREKKRPPKPGRDGKRRKG